VVGAEVHEVAFVDSGMVDIVGGVVVGVDVVVNCMRGGVDGGRGVVDGSDVGVYGGVGVCCWC